MRVLHLTPELPYEPGGGGGRGHEYFQCWRLVELGHDVLNISPVTPQEGPHAQALRDVGVENWTLERPASHRSEVVAAVRADPRVLATAVVAPVRALEMRVFWVGMNQLAQRAVSEWRPEVAVIGHDMAAAWAQSSANAARRAHPAQPGVALVPVTRAAQQWGDRAPAPCGGRSLPRAYAAQAASLSGGGGRFHNRGRGGSTQLACPRISDPIGVDTGRLPQRRNSRDRRGWC